MKFLGAPLISAALLALGAISSMPQTDAHSWLTKPVSRETGSRADIEGKVGCPSNTPGKSTSFKAGETIDVGYWRNNHLGGFIRWSMVPRGKESKQAFDSNAFYYTCRESGPTCVPKGGDAKTNMYAGDSSSDNSISCGDKITLPDWLPAGDYVLQWTWFGVGSSFGNIGWAEPQFRSCADIKLTTDGAKSAAPKCPVFVGGDRVTKMKGESNDKCWYFYTTDIVNSQYKGSNTDYASKYKFGVPAAVEKCGGGASSGGNSTEPATTTKAPKPAATSKAPKTKAPTSKAPKPATPGTKEPAGGEATTAPKPAATTKAPAAGGATKTPTPTKTSGCKVKRS